MIETLAVVSDRVSCRVVEENALLHCKICTRGVRIPLAPRGDFLREVRTFIHEHRECELPALPPQR